MKETIKQLLPIPESLTPMLWAGKAEGKYTDAFAEAKAVFIALMYTRRELKRAARIIRQIADEHNVPEEQIRLYMKEAMDSARLNPDPIIQARWPKFQYRGDEPTVEEFILWAAGMIDGK